MRGHLGGACLTPWGREHGSTSDLVAEGEERTGIRADNALGKGRERLKQSARKEQKRWTQKWEQIEAESGGGCGATGRNRKAKKTQARSREKGAEAGMDYLP